MNRIGQFFVILIFFCVAVLGGGYGYAAESTPADWDTVIAQAKKEGVVSLYALWKPAARTALTDAFRNKYGINVEFFPFSRGEDMVTRAEQEKTAGLRVVDVFGAGAPSLMTVLKPKGLLGSMRPHLVLPEVTDPKAWRGDKVPFMDKEETTVAMLASINRDIVYNESLIKKGEITTYKDLLKPQYKGKITMNDPSVTGVGNAFMNYLAFSIWSLPEASDFLKQLLTKQDLVIQRDNRMHIESVARGKYAIGLANDPDTLATFLKVKSPLGVVYTKEGIFVGPAAGAVALAANPAHPNAAKLFVNWLLSKEGQAVFAPSFGTPSLRDDVPTTGIDPVFLVQKGEKIYFSNEAEIISRPKMRAICKEIIEGVAK